MRSRGSAIGRGSRTLATLGVCWREGGARGVVYGVDAADENSAWCVTAE